MNNLIKPLMNKHLHSLLNVGFMLVILILGPGLTYAQEKKVSGVVTDAESGETLIGVNVTVASNKAIGTVTDTDGKYSLSVPDTVKSLSFSFVGYAPQVIEITGTVINVILSPGEQLSEVVVVGYGTQKTREVTSAVATVKSEDFNRGNISDPIQLVQGKVAGLAIAKPGNDPNKDFSIRLRGLSTFGSNTEPLIIIDGIPGANMKSIDPQDIVSIDVLKDASACAIYGTRAASGVILITTKKGEFVPGGKKFNVEFGSSLTYETVANTVSNLSTGDYVKLTEGDSTNHFGNTTNWFDEITSPSFSQTYNLAFNGADENTTYRVAVNYRDVEGVVMGTGFNQLNSRFNLTQKALKDKLTFDINLSTSLRNETYAPPEAMQYATIFNPTAPIKADDDFSEEWGGYFQRPAFYFYNPVAIIEQSDTVGKKYNIQGGFKGTYEIIKGLKASVFYSLTSNNDLYGTYWSKYALWTPYATGSHEGFANRRTNDYFNHMLELTGSYEKTIDKFSFTLLGGYSWQEATTEGFWAFGKGFLSDDFSYNDLGSASGELLNSTQMDSWKRKTTLIGYYARATANYNNGIFLTMNFRRDGSSMFGENNKWGNFPGISAGVDIAKYVTIPYVDRLKVRGGYGVTGNLPPDPYLSKLLYNSTNDYFFYNGDYIQAFGPIRNDNPDLKWETKRDVGFGLDYALLDYRISGSIDYYQSNSEDLLIYYKVPVPPNVAEYSWVNLGELKNSGIEFTIQYQTLATRQFMWTTDLNFAKYFETTLVEITDTLIGPETEVKLGQLGDPGLIGVHSIRVEEGSPVGQIVAPIYLYTDTAGAMWYRGAEGDTIRTPSWEDYQVVGSGLPEFQIGWGNTFTYKGFYLNFFLRGVFGHSLVNVNNAKFGVPEALGIQSGMDIINDFPDVTDGPSYSNVHVEKADFLRLDNWSLGYNFKIKENDYVQSLNVYLSGQNLFTITNYSGVDPEVRYEDTEDNNNALAPGLDRQDTYFSTRTFTLGVNVVF
jgi:TonB-linked SusC/RagA family outer membrane protein